MERCKCGNGLEVMFVCLEKSCPDYQSHPYYCPKCSSKKHKNHIVLIINEVEEQHKKWTVLREKIKTEFPNVKIAYEALKPLILYLEQAMFDPSAIIDREVIWISDKYK
jgi:hypothetical protein